jgi:hypothetical protein
MVNTVKWRLMKAKSVIQKNNFLIKLVLGVKFQCQVNELHSNLACFI